MPQSFRTRYQRTLTALLNGAGLEDRFYTYVKGRNPDGTPIRYYEHAICSPEGIVATINSGPKKAEGDYNHLIYDGMRIHLCLRDYEDAVKDVCMKLKRRLKLDEDVVIHVSFGETVIL